MQRLNFTLIQFITFIFFIFISTTLKGQGTMWGMTNRGGANGVGVIFKTSNDGTGQTVKYDFPTSYPGASPGRSRLELASNGKFYGVTPAGGINGVGVLYEFDPATSIYTKKVDFSTITGIEPEFGLTLASNNKLYGVAGSGGQFFGGTLFEYDPATNAFAVKFNFNLVSAHQGNSPTGRMVLASNGKLYGTTFSGGVGSGNLGVLFEFDPATAVYTVKINNLGTEGSFATFARCDMIQASDGLLYGIISSPSGGTITIFNYNITTNTFTSKLVLPPGFCEGLKEVNGKLYGIASTPSFSSFLFEYDPVANTSINKHTFVAGEVPPGVLELAPNGNLYGALVGVSIFEFNPVNGAYTNKFTNTTDFLRPIGSLKIAPDGKLYGFTQQGGLSNRGTIYDYNISTNTVTKRIDFSYAPNGAFPIGSVVQASNRLLYGMTPEGGLYGKGVLFQFDINTNTYTKLVDFSGAANGAAPTGGLIQSSNGKLYGTTRFGGTDDRGVVFEFDPATNVLTKLIDLVYTGPIGGSPSGNLAPGANGKFLGFNTSPNFGKLFELDPATNTLTTVWQLTVAVGSDPAGIPLLASNGKIYGSTTSSLSTSTAGTFVLDPATNTPTKFSNGCPIYGSFVQDANGKLYSMNSNTNGFGANIVEIDPLANTCTTKAALPPVTTNAIGGFSVAPGDYSLAYSTNGKYYGLLNANNLFEYTVATNTIATKTSFGGLTGNVPVGSLFVSLTPETNASAITFSPTYTTQFQVNFTPGNGNKRLVVIKQGGPVDFIPTENVAYNVGDVFSGNRIVKIDAGSNVYVTGLLASTTYHVKVFEYTELGTKKSYLVGGAAVANVTTLPPPDVPFTTPVNGAINQNVTVAATAKALTGATTYTLELNTDPNFITGTIVMSGARTQTFTGLTYSTLYYARVKTNLSPDYSIVTSFTTGPPEFFSYVINPVDGAVSQNCNLNVSSNTVIGATSYTIELNTASDFTGTSITKSGTPTFQGFNGLSLLTTYYTRVKTNLSPNWGPTKSFTVGDAPTLSFLTSPSNGAINQLWTLNLVSNLVTGATNYTIRVSTVSDFSSGVIQNSAGSNSVPFSSLGYSTMYFAQVSTNLSPGVWGPSRSFTTGYPSNFGFVSNPANNSTNVPRLVNLTAPVVVDATLYTIEANTASDFTGTSIVNSAASNAVPFALGYGTTYYTRVKTNLVPEWGPIRNFTTSTAASNSFLLTPASNAVNVLPSLNIVANDIVGASSYTIQLCALSDFSSGVISQTAATRTIPFSLLLPLTTYYSRVTTDLSPGEWGPTKVFTTIDQVMVSPANGAVNVNWVISISTGGTVGTSTYTIEANTLPDFTGTSIVQSSSSTFQTFTLAYDQTYYVRCKSNIAGGWGATRSFTTGNPVSLAFVVTPANGAGNVALSPTVTANSLTGATSYTIELNTASDFTGTSTVKTQASPVMSFTGLASGVTYYNRVKTSLNSTTWGPARSFSTVSARIAADTPVTTIEPEIKQEIENNAFNVVIDENPFRHQLSFTVKGESGNADIHLVDMLGRVILTDAVPINKRVDLATPVSQGIYILRVTHNEKVIIRRVIKE